ncbi:MAG: threonine/serine exporter family protein [Phascolarctobacterium sp.]|nr:threonine/serine exporter family protein [Phascolarctobacterium sp.]
MVMGLYESFVYSFLATIAFAVLFQAPKRTMILSGVIGAIGWVVFVYLRQHLEYNSFHSNFFATLVLALNCELCARLFKQPATVFLIPGIIPLVPGLGMYQGMKQIIEKSYEPGMNTLLTAGTDSAAIALGIMFTASIFRVLKMSANKKFGLNKWR